MTEPTDRPPTRAEKDVFTLLAQGRHEEARALMEKQLRTERGEEWCSGRYSSTNSASFGSMAVGFFG